MRTCDCPLVFVEDPEFAGQVHRYDCPLAPAPPTERELARLRRRIEGRRAAGVKARPGWERLSPPNNKIGAMWKHSSGWTVEHCGHATANWPYFLIDPRRPDHTTVSFNGLGFKNLEAAMITVESLAAGLAKTTTENCCARVACVVDWTALGEKTTAAR